jgi:hypothetical protein
MMHAANWPGFVALSCETGTGKSAPTLVAKRIYLGIVGVVMSLVEALQATFPNSALIRRLGHLSPLTPAARG